MDFMAELFNLSSFRLSFFQAAIYELLILYNSNNIRFGPLYNYVEMKLYMLPNDMQPNIQRILNLFWQVIDTDNVPKLIKTIQENQGNEWKSKLTDITDVIVLTPEADSFKPIEISSTVKFNVNNLAFPNSLMEFFNDTRLIDDNRVIGMIRQNTHQYFYLVLNYYLSLELNKHKQIDIILVLLVIHYYCQTFRIHANFISIVNNIIQKNSGHGMFVSGKFNLSYRMIMSILSECSKFNINSKLFDFQLNTISNTVDTIENHILSRTGELDMTYCFCMYYTYLNLNRFAVMGPVSDQNLNVNVDQAFENLIKLGDQIHELLYRSNSDEMKNSIKYLVYSGLISYYLRYPSENCQIWILPIVSYFNSYYSVFLNNSEYMERIHDNIQLNPNYHFDYHFVYKDQIYTMSGEKLSSLIVSTVTTKLHESNFVMFIFLYRRLQDILENDKIGFEIKVFMRYIQQYFEPIYLKLVKLNNHGKLKYL